MSIRGISINIVLSRLKKRDGLTLGDGRHRVFVSVNIYLPHRTKLDTIRFKSGTLYRIVGDDIQFERDNFNDTL